MRSSLEGINITIGQCTKYMTVYFIVSNNILYLNTTVRLTLLGDLGLSNKHSWQSAPSPAVPTTGCWGTTTVLSPPLPSSDPQPLWSLYPREGTTTMAELSYSVFLLRKRSWCVGLNDLSGWTPVNSYLAQARVYTRFVHHAYVYKYGRCIIRSFHSRGYIGENRIFVCVCAVWRVQHTHTSLGQSIGWIHVRSGSSIELLQM